MSGALDVLKMKVKDIFTFLATGMRSSVTTLDLQMVEHIYKRNSNGPCIQDPGKDLEEAAAGSTFVVTENTTDISIISRNTGQ